MDALEKKAGSMGRKIASPCPDAVRLVSLWTLSTGCFLLVIFALDHAFDHFNLQIPCSPSGIILRCVEPTDAVALAKAAAEIAGWIGMLWCGAAQAAAAALALHLPRRYRRVRCALAYIALPLAIVGHSLYTRATVLLYAVDPGSLFAVIGWTQIIVFLAVFDLLCFLILLLGREVRTDCD